MMFDIRQANRKRHAKKDRVWAVAEGFRGMRSLVRLCRCWFQSCSVGLIFSSCAAVAE